MARTSDPKRKPKIARGVRFDADTIKALEAFARRRRITFSRAVLIATTAGIETLGSGRAA